MDARRLISVVAVVVVALVVLPAAASAKTVEFRGVVSGSPYGASNGYLAVPVLYSKQTLRYQHLKSPVGLLMVKKALAVKLPNGAPKIVPVNMRVGDRFKGKVVMKSIYQRTFYPRVTFDQVTVYFRSKELSTAELNDMILKVRKDLDNLTDFVGKLTNYTTANFAAVRADIADLRAQLDSLKNALNGLTSQLTSLTTQLNAITQILTDKLNQLTDTVGGIATQVQGLLTQVGSLQTALTSLTGRVQNLEDALALLQNAIGPLQNLTGSVVTNLTNLQSTLDQVQTLLGGIDTSQLTSALSQLSDLQTSVGGLITTVTGQNGISDRLTAAETTLGAVAPTVTSLNDTVTGPNGLTTKVTGLLTNVAALQLDGADAAQNITNLTNSLATTNSNLDGITTTVNTVLTPQVGGLMTDVSKLKTQMTAVCGTVSSNVTKTNSLITLTSVLGGGLTALPSFTCP